MPYPVNPLDNLLLEDGASYLLLEDDSSRLQLDEAIHLDDPLQGTTSVSLTPTLSFIGEELGGNALNYQVQIDTVNTFNGGELIDASSDNDVGFTDQTTSLGDDKITLEDGTSYLLQEDNTSRLVLNRIYPQGNDVTYTVQADLSGSTIHYWRVRHFRQQNGVTTYSQWSDTQSFTTTAGPSFTTVLQSGADLTLNVGTQTFNALTSVSVSQVSADLVATAGAQVIVAKIAIALAQVAANLTLTSGTETVDTVNNVSISQVTVPLRLIALGDDLLLEDGTSYLLQEDDSSRLLLDTPASSGTGTTIIVGTVITQELTPLTLAGGTQVVESTENAVVSQSASDLVLSPGTQNVSITYTLVDASVVQSTAELLLTGNTQVVESTENVNINQPTYDLVLSTGTQSISAIVAKKDTSITQSAATLLLTGNTQIITTSTGPLPGPRPYYLDTNGNVYWVLDQSLALVERI